MQHAGGYTPFVVDATGLLKTGKENELLVRLDNRNNSLIPPGKPLETLDFCYYGGIYRNVHLIAKADVHITHPILDGHPAGAGIFITYPKVSQELSVVDAKTEIKNTSDKEKVVELRHTLYTWKKQKGKDKKSTEHFRNTHIAPWRNNRKQPAHGGETSGFVESG